MPNPITTENQLRHHTEQMEAARREFEKLWKETLLPAINARGVFTMRGYNCIEQVCWLEFKLMRGLK